MEHLEEISTEDLQNVLDNVEGKKPTQRLLAAIVYKNGVSQIELTEWYGVERKTIYNWLTRLDTDESLEQTVTDAHRSGRKRKLSETEQEQFEATVHKSPEEVGLDALAWTPPLYSTILRKPTMSSTHSRVAGGCSKKRD